MKKSLLIITLTFVALLNYGSEMESKKLELKERKVTINYYSEGNGDTTLLFLHGWCINGKYWENQFAKFKSNYKVIAIDLPGFGESTTTRENLTIEAYAADILAFIDELKLKNVVLIGHSMSGSIIAEAAIIGHPSIIGLVGVDNYKYVDVNVPDEQMQQYNAYMEQLKVDFKNTAVGAADYQLFIQTSPEEVKNRVKNDIANTDPKVGFNTLMNFYNYMAMESTKLEQLQLKLYLINSDAIPTNVQGLENRCKKGFEVKNGGTTGHYPMIEKPQVFNQKLKEILNEL